MPEVNEELIRIVMKRIERDQEHWNQSTWAHVAGDQSDLLGTPIDNVPCTCGDSDCSSGQGLVISTENMEACGTSFCFAGHTLAEVGGYGFIILDGGSSAAWVQTPDGALRCIGEEAGRVLGLNEDQADELFSGAHCTLPGLKEVISRMTGIVVD